MNHRELRRTFLEFYAQREHKIVPSSSLIPKDDPTLLFTSAGMVQFKALWAGAVELPYRRACSIQKCLRASDLEKVGKTPRHCTFFEMLGNFSFGDYFKAEAIPWAWEYLTQVVKLDPAKLYVSVFEDDEEAYEVWHKKVGLPEKKIYRLGEKDNFWGPAGGTGACGPCSEIYVDLGPEFGCGKDSCGPGCDCDRFSEVYNIVFPQFNQLPDGKREPLKNRGIDTGMGLERLAMVSQGKRTIFDTDLFLPLVRATEEILGKGLDAENRQMFYVAVDHARALTFAITDGAIPSNEGRGYVLRNILRRALLFAFRGGVQEPFLFRVCGAVVELMRQFYPELTAKREQVALIVRAEEERFLRTLAAGLERWEETRIRYQQDGTIPGEELFKLHDTYGFHIELVEELAADAGLKLDRAGFERAMQEQKERSRKATFITTGLGGIPVEAGTSSETEFVGYESDETESELVSFVRQEDGSYELVLRRTPFYAEAGGQVGDTGRVVGEGFEFEVQDSYFKHGVRVLRAVLKSGEPKTGVVFAAIDKERRREIERAHTATHLLHAALRRVVGDYVKQEGSLVEPGRLRFDFAAFEPLKLEQINEVERLVYEAVLRDIKVERLVDVPLEEAKRMGALAFFGEQYGERVRVLKIGDFSMELCGGTHLRRTGEVGLLRIVAETGVAAGIRRIEAVVGRQAFERVKRERQTLDQIEEHLGVGEEALFKKVVGLTEELKRVEARVRQLSAQLARNAAAELVNRVETVAGVQMVQGDFPFFEVEELRIVADRLRELLMGSYAVLLTGAVAQDRLRFVVMVSPDLQSKLPAGKLAKVVGSAMAGGGGGRQDIAEGGGRIDRRDAGRQALTQALIDAQAG
ncbi:MAG: alanine--tRNA ligase [candidate division WOR-3 bacterium]|jgi:alanyl-tRNA synthetase|nr:alanine--tRNA ligase [candidate division WOR-3 bacterium]MDH7519709.1 alanine--tRNA ligase [bacterium]